MNSKELKGAAREFGADLVGIASIDRFSSLPADRHPSTVFPECKSVIVIGRRILRGSLRGVEEGTNFGSTYHFFGYQMLEDNFLAQTTYDLTRWIEERSFESVPLFCYHPEGMPKGAPVAPGKPAPNVIVDFEFAAQAAGLAEMGLGNLLLTKEYGTRQRFAMILTDAALEPDQVFDKSVCGDCKACAESCPLKAIDTSKTWKFGVEGHQMDVATVDFKACAACPNGAAKAGGRGDRPDRLAAACARTCLARLENSAKCSNQFKNPFRKRKPWALDALKRPVEPGEAASSKAGCDKFTTVR